MKKSLMILALAVLASSPAISRADGVYQEPAPARRSRPARVSAAEPLPPPPTCSSKSPARKIELVSFDPNQPAGKVVGSIQECVTTMYDVLHLLSGPNTIGLKYPEER